MEKTLPDRSRKSHAFLVGMKTPHWFMGCVVTFTRLWRWNVVQLNPVYPLIAVPCYVFRGILGTTLVFGSCCEHSAHAIVPSGRVSVCPIPQAVLTRGISAGSSDVAAAAMWCVLHAPVVQGWPAVLGVLFWIRGHNCQPCRSAPGIFHWRNTQSYRYRNRCM